MRKEKIVTITAEGRDKGRNFKVTEMPATQAEKWATRAFLALANGGVDLPEEALSGGMQGIAVLGFQALGRARYADVQPLFDEMLGCVQAQPDPAANPNFFRALMEDDTEEVSTLLTLRSEVFEVHTGFSIAAVISSAYAAAQQKMAQSLPIIPTSRPPSER